jgi:hypothetical protein
MKTILFSFLFFFALSVAQAQDKPSTIDFKFGVGVALLGTGDYSLYRFESELTKKWHSLISSSFAFNVGAGYRGGTAGYLYHVNSYHADLNLFLSPFGNQRRNNLKMGTGLTWIYANVTASRGSSEVYDPTNKTYTRVETFSTETRKASGFSMIVEDEMSIGAKYLLGVKIIVQPYTNADILSSISLKFGIKL